jgi:hypothetical protein
MGPLAPAIPNETRPNLTKADMLDWARKFGLRPPTFYEPPTRLPLAGFPCAGM